MIFRRNIKIGLGEYENHRGQRVHRGAQNHQAPSVPVALPCYKSPDSGAFRMGEDKVCGAPKKLRKFFMLGNLMIYSDNSIEISGDNMKILR